MLIDLHNHALPCSTDSSVDVARIAFEAAELGVGGIALTDHSGGGDFDLARAVIEERGLIFVPGREIVCALGHALVFTTDTTYLRDLPPRCELPLPRGARGDLAVVWAHPAGWRVAGAMIEPNVDLPEARFVHGVEVLNAARLWQNGGVEFAAGVAARLQAGQTGGSDAHAMGATGRCLTRVAGARDAADVVEALRSGATSAVLGSRWAAKHMHAYERPDLVPYLEREVDSTP
ncbi:MAG: hypothetical protein NVSMB57_04870 [Actinomycetota bacterium]